MRLLFATANEGKLREVRALLAPLGVETVGLKETAPNVALAEDGESFVENARIKARALHAATGLAVLADDSGLVVEALGGLPGVRSARYAGEGATDGENNAKLLAELSGVGEGERGAAFRCAMVLVGENGAEAEAEGTLRGTILTTARGTEGFGYDPLFRPEGETRSLAEMPGEEKNRISHRRRALDGLLPVVEKLARAASAAR